MIRAEKEWMRQVFVALAGEASLGAALHLLYEGAMVAHTAGGREDAVPTARTAAARLIDRDAVDGTISEVTAPPGPVSAAAAATTSAAAPRAS